MPKIFPKFTSLLLCGLLFYNSVGYMLVFWLERESIRQQNFANLLTRKSRELVQFSADELGNSNRLIIVNDQEIMADGKMYDVVEKRQQGEKTILFCKYDSEEQSLIDHMRAISRSGSNGHDENTAKLIVSQIIKIALPNLLPESLKPDFQIIKFVEKPFFYSNPFLGIPELPPRNLIS